TPTFKPVVPVQLFFTLNLPLSFLVPVGPSITPLSLNVQVWPINAKQNQSSYTELDGPLPSSTPNKRFISILDRPKDLYRAGGARKRMVSVMLSEGGRGDWESSGDPRLARFTASVYSSTIKTPLTVGEKYISKAYSDS
ncbi:11677_t:CDS:2, partial [Acaulospora colombiana]